MKTTEIVDNIFKNHMALILNLIKLDRRDPKIIALMLCELHFSSSFKRTIEYLAWSFLTIFKLKRRYYISVGVSQVQIRYWLSHNFVNDKLSLRNLSQLLNIKCNYDLIECLFQSYDCKKLTDSNIIAIYRGEARVYHLNLFIALKKRLSPSVSSVI